MTERRKAPTGAGSYSAYRGSVLVTTFRTDKRIAPTHKSSLEYRFLGSVVKTGLAKVMRWHTAAIGTLENIHELFSGQFVKSVTGSIIRFLAKSHVCFLECSDLVFQRMHLLNCRRLFLLQLQGGVLDVENPVFEALQRSGELRVIPCGNGDSREVERAFDGRNGGTN